MTIVKFCRDVTRAGKDLKLPATWLDLKLLRRSAFKPIECFLRYEFLRVR